MNTNIVVLSGRATKDIELKTTTNGTNIATISLAVNGYKEEVSYFDIILFGKTAETAEKYVSKGKQVNIIGRLQQRKWEDKQGNNRYSVEVIANSLELLGGGGERRDDRPMTQSQALNGGNDVVIDDIDDSPISLEDIPF